jgi:hypothetical protein
VVVGAYELRGQDADARLSRSGGTEMSLSDEEKIDRAARHEEVRFLKRQQWAVAAAGVVLISALLTFLKDVHVTRLDKFLILVLITAGVAFGCYFLNDLQCGLARVREALDPRDWEASTRGRPIMLLLLAILVGTLLFAWWLIVFKLD